MPARPTTLQLIVDLVRQVQQLVSIEMDLAKAELAESAGSLSSGAIALAAGAAVAFAGFIFLLAAAGAFLVRLGAPLDVACLVVAAAALLAGFLLLRSGSRALRPEKLLPARSFAQLSSLLGRR
jgi:Putative Actinobacterial Holin-X, holin superfamily III